MSKASLDRQNSHIISSLRSEKERLKYTIKTKEDLGQNVTLENSRIAQIEIELQSHEKPFKLPPITPNYSTQRREATLGTHEHSLQSPRQVPSEQANSIILEIIPTRYIQKPKKAHTIKREFREVNLRAPEEESKHDEEKPLAKITLEEVKYYQKLLKITQLPETRSKPTIQRLSSQELEECYHLDVDTPHDVIKYEQIDEVSQKAHKIEVAIPITEDRNLEDRLLIKRDMTTHKVNIILPVAADNEASEEWPGTFDFRIFDTDFSFRAWIGDDGKLQMGDIYNHKNPRRRISQHTENQALNQLNLITINIKEIKREAQVRQRSFRQTTHPALDEEPPQAGRYDSEEESEERPKKTKESSTQTGVGRNYEKDISLLQEQLELLKNSQSVELEDVHTKSFKERETLILKHEAEILAIKKAAKLQEEESSANLQDLQAACDLAIEKNELLTQNQNRNQLELEQLRSNYDYALNHINVELADYMTELERTASDLREELSEKHQSLEYLESENNEHLRKLGWSDDKIKEQKNLLRIQEGMLKSLKRYKDRLETEQFELLAENEDLEEGSDKLNEKLRGRMEEALTLKMEIFLIRHKLTESQQQIAQNEEELSDLSSKLEKARVTIEENSTAREDLQQQLDLLKAKREAILKQKELEDASRDKKERSRKSAGTQTDPNEDLERALEEQRQEYQKILTFQKSLLEPKDKEIASLQESLTAINKQYDNLNHTLIQISQAARQSEEEYQLELERASEERSQFLESMAKMDIGSEIEQAVEIRVAEVRKLVDEHFETELKKAVQEKLVRIKEQLLERDASLDQKTKALEELSIINAQANELLKKKDHSIQTLQSENLSLLSTTAELQASKSNLEHKYQALGEQMRNMRRNFEAKLRLDKAEQKRASGIEKMLHDHDLKRKTKQLDRSQRKISDLELEAEKARKENKDLYVALSQAHKNQTQTLKRVHLLQRNLADQSLEIEELSNKLAKMNLERELSTGSMDSFLSGPPNSVPSSPMSMTTASRSSSSDMSVLSSSSGSSRPSSAMSSSSTTQSESSSSGLTPSPSKPSKIPVRKVGGGKSAFKQLKKTPTLLPQNQSGPGSVR